MHTIAFLGETEWAFSPAPSRNCLNRRAHLVPAVPVRTSPIVSVDTTLKPWEFSRGAEIAAGVCSETFLFSLMSPACFPGSVPNGGKLKLGKREEESNQIILWLQSCLNKCFLAALILSLPWVIKIFTSLL